MTRSGIKNVIRYVVPAILSIVVDSVVILILPQIFGEGVIWFSLLIDESIVLVFAVILLKHSEQNGICFKSKREEVH